MVVCEQHEHCPYMNMMFKMVIVSMKMFVMIKVPIDMIMVLKIGIEQIEPCPYLIVMIVSKMMLVMIITVLKMMMLVMIKGVGECRLVAKSKHRPPRFDNFDKPDYPLFVHNVDPRLYQFELLEFYLRLSGHLAYLRKDERAV